MHSNYHSLKVPRKIVNDGGRMSEPWGIAFGKDGMWAVLYYSNDYVYTYIFDSQGHLVGTYGSEGNCNDQFNIVLQD